MARTTHHAGRSPTLPASIHLEPWSGENILVTDELLVVGYYHAAAGDGDMQNGERRVSAEAIVPHVTCPRNRYALGHRID